MLSQSKSAPILSAAPPPPTSSFRITGMTCAGCAAGLQRTLEADPGIHSATVSIVSGLARVSTTLSADEVIARIRQRGFDGTQELSGAAVSATEQQQHSAETRWKRRAIAGLTLWLPLELLHWSAAGLHWHPDWMPLLMAAGSGLVLLITGPGFLKSAWQALLNRTANMDTLIALGAGTAWLSSALILALNLNQPTWFGEAAGLLAIVSLGHWLEAKVSSRAGSAVRDLLSMQPETVSVVASDGTEVTARLEDVQPGSRIRIRPGDRVPVDGTVLEGLSDLDESIITGESLPVMRGPGDHVVAGSINTTGQLLVAATVPGTNTTVDRIAGLVEQAQSSRAPVQRLADLIAAVFVPTVLAIALLTLVGWVLAGDLSGGIAAAVSVLIISCPCALGLATPMAVMAGTGAASQRGILIRSAEALERAGRAREIIFDKTGTLTGGHPELIRLQVLPGFDSHDVLRLAAAVETLSEHPAAHAVVEAARRQELTWAQATQFRAFPGIGVEALVNGKSVRIERDAQASSRILIDNVPAALMELQDTLRPDATAAVTALQKMGVHVRMLSGDRPRAAAAIAEAAGIAPADVTADASPEQKLEILRASPACTIMVGDGLNDAAALTAAPVGIAIGCGTGAAMEAASVIVPGNRLLAIPEFLQIARDTLRVIRQNLFLAFFYNGLAIPLAALGMLGQRGPLIAAVAMALSDLAVVGNALRLKHRLDRRSIR